MSVDCMAVGGPYRPDTAADTCGVNPVARGAATAYTPWYFNGRVVYWGPTYADYITAATYAQSMRTTPNSIAN